jgi:hypothetical protein
VSTEPTAVPSVMFDRHSLATQKLLAEGFNPDEAAARFRRRAVDAVDHVTSAYALNEAFGTSQTRRRVESTVSTVISATRSGDRIWVYSHKVFPGLRPSGSSSQLH